MSPALDPLSVTCPVCQVPAGEQCTAPTSESRRPVKRAHLGRIERATGNWAHPVVHDWHTPVEEGEPIDRDHIDRDARERARAEAERRYPDEEDTYLERIVTKIARAAFLDGAEWGSRPF